MTQTETPVEDSRYPYPKDIVWSGTPNQLEATESSSDADRFHEDSEDGFFSDKSKSFSVSVLKGGVGKTGLVLDMAMSAALHKKGRELGYSEEEIEERLAKLDESVIDEPFSSIGKRKTSLD